MVSGKLMRDELTSPSAVSRFGQKQSHQYSPRLLARRVIPCFQAFRFSLGAPVDLPPCIRHLPRSSPDVSNGSEENCAAGIIAGIRSLLLRNTCTKSNACANRWASVASAFLELKVAPCFAPASPRREAGMIVVAVRNVETKKFLGLFWAADHPLRRPASSSMEATDFPTCHGRRLTRFARPL